MLFKIFAFLCRNNFLRVWVLRVCQQSEKHLDKILNVDEFVKRIFQVMHSNDPVARALTLRTLGAVAGKLSLMEIKREYILMEKKFVYFFFFRYYSRAGTSSSWNSSKFGFT